MTWDGQPAGEMAAAIDAVIAAAWCAGRDAAKNVVVFFPPPAEDTTDALDVCERDCRIAHQIAELSPPPGLLSTLRPGGTP